MHLLFAANEWEMKETILSKLGQGKHVICDRYAYSGVAYSAAKGLDFDWCQGPYRGFVKPDLVFYIDASAEKLAQRSGFGGERYETEEFQSRVETEFAKFKTSSIAILKKDFVERLESSETQPERTVPYWVNITADSPDGGKGIDEIEAEINLVVKLYQEKVMEKISLD